MSGTPLRLAAAPTGRPAAATRPHTPALTRQPGVVTLKDVAAQAKVHPATASRALHPSTRHLVKEGTARRVMRAAESLGYVANHAAASLRTRSTRTVGVLLPDLGDQHAAALTRGLGDQLAAAGYMALTASTDGDPLRERMFLTMMRGRHVDGLILAGVSSRTPLAAAAIKTGLPVIAAGTVPESGTLLPAVSADLPRGMRLVVEHLVSLGHKAIACITGPGESGRHRDFLAAMASRGLPPPPLPALGARAHTAEEGKRCCQRLLADRPVCTAMIATSDMLAAGCCQALAEAGVDCPQDISVAGCGDLPLAACLTPQLTTVRLPQYHVGVQVAQLFLERIADPHSPPVARLLAPELVVRASTAPVRPRLRPLAAGEAG